MLNFKLLKSFYPSEDPISQVKNIDLKTRKNTSLIYLYEKMP
jgi:hypothetical protein